MTIRRSLKGDFPDLLDIGKYWYDDRKTKTNGEFDCALSFSDGSYVIYEAKFLSAPLGIGAMEEEAGKIKRIPDLNIRSIGFVSSSGFESTAAYECITGEDLYSKT